MNRIIVVLLIVAAGVAAWRFWPIPGLSGLTATHTETAARPAGRRGGFSDQPTPVIAADIKRQDVPVFLEGVGTFQAPKTVTVRPQVEGTLVEVAFREGQDVKEGDVLARIDPLTYKAQYDQAVAQKAQFEAQLANAQRDYDRYQRLAKNDFGSQQQAETAKASVAQLEAQVRYYGATIDQAKATLDRTVVRAPLSGRTGVRGVDQGNYVTAGETTGIVTITQLQPISATFTLPQQDIQAVTAAMAKGSVSVEALTADGGDPLDRGTLEVIDNQVDQATGTVKLKATFPNEKLALWPGQFTNVRVAVSVLNDVVVAPGPSVQQGPDGPFVYVVKSDNTVAQRAVEITRQDADLAVIGSGVEPGDKVVTTGFTRLRDGAKIVLGAPGAKSGPDGETPSAAAEERPERRAQGATAP